MLKRFLSIVALCGMLVPGAALADYPERPITFLVPHAAGGGSDATARSLIPYMEKYLGGSIAVVNRPGASGSVAYTELVNAEPDGYTLAMVNFPDAVSAPITKDVAFDFSSFAYIGAINNEPSVIGVLASSPFHTFDDLLAKAKDSDVKMGVPGVGNVHDLAVVKLANRTGADFDGVPFNGGGPTRNALLGGHVESAMLSYSAMSRAGEKVRILGVFDKDPIGSIPTMASLGVNATNHVYRNFAAPKDIPADVLAKLRSAFDQAISDPEFLATAEKQKIAVVPASGAEVTEIAEGLDKELRELWAKSPWLEQTN